MATELRDASGTLIGYRLDHTAEQLDTAINNAMGISSYDPNHAVSLAGGIPAYVSEVLENLDGEEVSY